MHLTWETYWVRLEIVDRKLARCLRSACKRYSVAKMELIDGLPYFGRTIYYALYWTGATHILLSIHRQSAAAQRACQRHAAAL